jgi:hypothetical protein
VTIDKYTVGLSDKGPEQQIFSCAVGFPGNRGMLLLSKPKPRKSTDAHAHAVADTVASDYCRQGMTGNTVVEGTGVSWVASLAKMYWDSAECSVT